MRPNIEELHCVRMFFYSTIEAANYNHIWAKKLKALDYLALMLIRNEIE